MSKRVPFLTLYTSTSGGYFEKPHSAWADEEPDIDVAAYKGGSSFVFSAADMQPQQNYDALFGEGSSLSLLAAATRLIEVVDERMMLLKVPLEVDGPFLTDAGEVAARFIMGKLPAAATPAKKEAEEAKAEGQSNPDASKGAPKNPPQEPTPQEKLDAFINQLASQSKALTGKEFRLEGGADYLFISSEQLPTFFRVTQKTWAGVGQVFDLLGIKKGGGQSLDLFERAALSMIIDTPDLGPEDREEFELILLHLEGTGSRLTGDFHRAYREMSHAFSSTPELSTGLHQLRAALKLGAMPAEAVSYMESHSAFAQLLFQLIFVYESGGTIINQRVTTVFRKYEGYRGEPPADQNLRAFGLFMYKEIGSRLLGMGNKVRELKHTPTHVLERTREDWAEQREVVKELAPDAEDIILSSPFYSHKLAARVRQKTLNRNVRERLLRYVRLSRAGDVLAVAAILAVAVLDVLIEDLDEELAKRRANPEGR